jgi:hypothetical protein
VDLDSTPHYAKKNVMGRHVELMAEKRNAYGGLVEKKERDH